MREDVYDEGLRKYLLGELNEAEQQALEERLLSGDELFDLLLLAEDELIDDYLSGALSTDEHGRFDSFFLSTPDRRRKLSFAMALRRYVTAEAAAAEPAVAESLPRVETRRSPVVGHPSSWWKQAFSSPYLRMAVAAVIVLGLGLGTWRVFFYQSEVAKGMAALERAYNAERPVEARISGLGYAALANTRGSEPGKVDSVSLNRAERILLDEAAEHPGPSSHHALGELYLAERRFDDAIKQFEEALKADGSNAKLHSDLGAALLEKGKADRSTDDSGKGLEELAKSLEHLNNALELDGSLLEALFNRGLCHEYMKLPRQAQEDWNVYLEKDSISKWADEARHKLKELAEEKNKVSQTKDQLFEDFVRAYQTGDQNLAWEAFSRSRIRSGNFIVEKLIQNYLERSAQSRSQEAKKALDVLSYAGALEFQNVGDRFTLDLAEFYKTVSSKQEASLIRARELVKAGQIQLAESSFKSAFQTYNQAKWAFDQVGDKCESKSADYWLAICYSQEIDPQQSESRFRQIAAEGEKDNYKWLIIRSLNGLAYYNIVLNEYSKVIKYSDRSRELAEETQDAYGLALALSNLIKAYSSLGNHQRSLNYLQHLLSLAADTSIEPIQSCLCYARTAWTLYLEGLLTAALDYQKLALEVALELKELTMICTAYVNLGMIYAKLNNLDEALENVHRALEIAKTRSGEITGSLMMAYASLHLSSLLRQTGDLHSAIASYNKTIELYDGLDYPLFVHEAHKGLLYCFIGFGDTASAKEELGKAIGYYEQHRSKIREQSNRNTFFDLEQDIYDVAIDFEYSKTRSPQVAFEYSELSRARSLLDIMRKGRVSEGDEGPEIASVTQPLSSAQIQEGLPERAQVIEYAVLENKLLVWLLTKTFFKTLEQPITSRELGERIQNYSLLVSTPESNPDELSRSARELHDLLIGPVEPFLDRNKQLFIIADKFLNNIPFQSLISPATGRYLIEDYQLALSPSSSVLIACSETARAKGKIRQETALSVGVTRFDHSEYSDLADLPSAATEARGIADFYTPSSALIAEGANKKELLREIRKANVIHIASHFIPSDSSPKRSKLLLVNEHKADRDNRLRNDILETSEIYKTGLPAAKLVVLSACRTGIERYYRGEGAISIAHAFIAAGVPLVVASLWAIDSDSTTELMINFHRYRTRDGLSSAEALRRAQLKMINSEDVRYRHPYYWASFNLIGGYADY